MNNTLFVVDIIVLTLDLACLAFEFYRRRIHGTTEVRTASGRKVYGRAA